MTQPSPPVAELLAGLVLDVPDFPQPGVVFKDITPLLAHPIGLKVAIQGLADAGRVDGDVVVDAVAGLDARGFLFGTAVAQLLGVGFVPIRKHGKLPREVYSLEYELEYGSATLEIHRDAVKPGARVLIVDDVLATGGTIGAAVQLIEQCGAEASGAAVLIELGFLGGRERVAPLAVTSLLQY